MPQIRLRILKNTIIALTTILALEGRARGDVQSGPAEGFIYTIAEGDTPVRIAKRYGVAVDELLSYNQLTVAGRFRVGDEIKIPPTGGGPARTYEVKTGDSIAKIADHHGVSQKDLLFVNNLKKDTLLQLGQILQIPVALRGGAGVAHVVRKGDTLAALAKRYRVDRAELRRANKLKKRQPLSVGRTLVIPGTGQPSASPVKGGPGRRSLPQIELVSGEKVPEGVLHTVQPKQTIWKIARAYNVNGIQIAKANNTTTRAKLESGQKLLIPGAKAVMPIRYKGYVPKPVRFTRAGRNQRLKIRLTTKSGRVIHRNRRALSKLAGDKKNKKRFRMLNNRLVQLLQRVAERYPGKTIDIVSGYRPRSRGSESRHGNGKALDFRVSGVSNRELFDFCTQLPKTGCGFYPNSVFIHMDVRNMPYKWVDTSGPGERSSYVDTDSYLAETDEVDTDPIIDEGPPAEMGLMN